MISINRCRNLILYLLAKNNYGTIDVAKFDAFCDLAVMSIFEDLFYKTNLDSIRKNNNLTNEQYADLKKIREEQLDVYAVYSVPSNFVYNSTDNLWDYVGTDLYRANTVSVVHTATGKKVNIQEKLKGTQLNNSINSQINPPTLTFPICVRLDNSFRIYPTLPSGYTAELLYIRKPKRPKWTYTMQDGNAVYNAGASDLQDIDLHESLFERFIVKVGGYCGLSLREDQVLQMSAMEEQKILSEQKQ